jgi:hypothetical protein
MEIWKDIPGTNGNYKASTLGRIRSMPHIRKYKIKGKILKLSRGSDGILLCGVVVNGEKKVIAVSKLIAITFLSYEPKNGMVIDHNDFDNTNNKLDNLQIITQRENLSKDKFRKNPTSLFTGVCWHKTAKKWICNITVDNKLVHLGYFINELEAAKAYQNKLKLL